MQIANVEQAAAWDGPEGDQWTENAAGYERAGWRHVTHLVSGEVIGTSDRVLDIGCGTGSSTLAAARLATAGSALGVDLSRRMLDRARGRAAAEGLGNVEFLQADAQVHPFEPGSAEVAMSSFGCMFFGDPVAAFANIATALRPGGHLALLAWRELQRNDWVRTLREALALGRELPVPPPDAPTPFSLADPERTASVLEAAGYGAVSFEPVDEPMEWGSDPASAFAFLQTVGIVEGLLHGVDDAGRAEAMANIERMVAAHSTPEGVLVGSSAWLITATRA